MKKTLILSIFALASLGSRADEGMWMLTDLKAQNAAVMQDLGLDLSIDSIYCPDGTSLKDAVVHFGGGCTGEVISPDGLVLTNHHCGYGYIQQHSSVDHDYLTDGFWAKGRSGELPCRGLSVTFIDRILDVTDYVAAQLRKDDDPEGLNYLSPSYLERVAARFAREEHIRTDEFTTLELKPFYGANRYYLFVKTAYKDVRLVGAPPSSIGKFGADTDNWMWPRHCGDFSLFRIYAAKDGRPAAYSADNVPLRVKRHLAINLRGVKEGDFTFVMGFPGRNWRYMVSDEVEERMQTTNFMRDTVRGVRLRALAAEMGKDAATRIQYAAKYASAANYWKNAIGMNEGLVRLKVLARKKAEQERLLAFGRETGNDAYRQAFDTIRSIVARRRSAMFHQQAIYEALMLGTEFSRIPSTEDLLAALRHNDAKATAKAVEQLRKDAADYFDKDYNPDVDRTVSKQMLALYARLIPAAERISVFATIGSRYGGDTDAFVDDCFSRSLFRNAGALEAFLRQPSYNKLKNDPMVEYALSVSAGYDAAAAAMKAETDAYNRAHKTWVAGMLALKRKDGQAVYPDANSTLRLTYGKVGSYEPADGKEYLCRTTLKGVMEKEDPQNPEFTVPARLKELYAARDFGPYALPDGRMPVCFATATDNTGGNSGSPVFNARGELVGTAFDRNYEGLTGDIAYNPQLQRASCVDIRYILFIIDKFAGAGHLLDEMTLIR